MKYSLTSKAKSVRGSDGEPMAIAEHVGPFSVSAQQTLVYQTINSLGTTAGTQQVVWMNRKGDRGPFVTMPGLTKPSSPNSSFI